MISFYLDPIPKLSIAMRRVAVALAATAPAWARVVRDVDSADVQLLHPVALNAMKHVKARRYAVMMHCLSQEQQNGGNVPIIAPKRLEPWSALWSRALAVWSYYPIADRYAWARKSALVRGQFTTSEPDRKVGPHLYFAPLGVDTSTFTLPKAQARREFGILTTGYVSGPEAEAIEEAAVAAYRAGLTTVHLGPSEIGGMTAKVPGWSAVNGVSDEELAAIYQRCRWVSGLRHGEGFELPVLEGLASGARPICFDLPCYRQWFNGYAVFVPEASGDALIESLTAVMEHDPEPVSEDERERVVATFDWLTLARGFWQTLELACAADGELSIRMNVLPPAVVEPVTTSPVVSFQSSRRRVLWVGDSPTTPWTGFGRATTRVLDVLQRSFDVHCLGTTHNSFDKPYDRAEIPYDVYPYRLGMVSKLVTDLRPDVVLMQHDPWQIQNWLKETGDATVIATMPIDGLNCRTDYLNNLSLAIWWTEFAYREAKLGGYVGPSTVVPLGVDLETYQPVERAVARERMGLPRELRDAFIVGVVARNQPRKRLDLTVRHFAEWVKTRDVQNAYLYIQTAPTSEAAYDIPALMKFERFSNRLIDNTRGMRKNVDEALMPSIYSSLDVYFSTTQGEGWGLPVMEAMACGVPVVAPDWSALGDWARPAACLVPCSDIAGTINFGAEPRSGTRIAVIGGVPDRKSNVETLDRLYRDRVFYADRVRAGLALVAEPRYRWEQIGESFKSAIDQTLGLSLGQKVLRGDFSRGENATAR
jgi:glycosyltransferase involved in cell wall biosynthesis